MALKWLRDNLRHLKFILWGVVVVFVLLVFVDWGAGRAGRSDGIGASERRAISPASAAASGDGSTPNSSSSILQYFSYCPSASVGFPSK